MFELVMDNPLRFLLALLIGVATGWWIWARWAAEAKADADVPAAPAAPEPVAAPAAEPVPAAAAPVAAPLPVAEPEPAPEPVALAGSLPEGDARPKIAAAVGADDDLRLIKGIGPKLNELCLSLGVRRFDQIAAWGAAEVDEVDQHLGNFRGRIARDEWVAQAKLLAAGKLAEWEATYGGGTNT